MDISKSTYELLQLIVARINNAVGVTSVVNNNDGTFTLNTCNILWATLGFPITINGVEYQIVDIEDGVSITVKPKTGNTAPPAGTFALYVPKFYHGTIKATETDLNKKVNNKLLSWDKLPMIWLHEPVEEITSPAEEEMIYRKSNGELYFLNDADFAKWSNDDHYKYAIKPMRKLFMAFYEAMKYSGLINEDSIKSYKLVDLPRFGEYKVISGNKNNQNQGESQIFAQYHLSGTKVGIQFAWLRNQDSCCEIAYIAPVISGEEEVKVFFNGVLINSFTHSITEDLTVNIIPTP